MKDEQFFLLSYPVNRLLFFKIHLAIPGGVLTPWMETIYLQDDGKKLAQDRDPMISI